MAGIKRSHVLLMVIVVLVGAALALRVREYVNRPVVVLNERPERVSPATLPPPRDYVVSPAIDPQETDAGPARIVSLAPSITEIVCALGLQDRLVGRSTFSLYPPGIDQVADVGSLTDANLAKIQGLAPNLVLVTSNSGPLPDNLRKLGMNCRQIPHESLEEVYEAIETIGRICDRPRTAGHLVEAIRRDINDILAWVEISDVPPRRVLLVFGPLPVPPQAVFVAGPGIFFDTLIQMAGHRNAARELLQSPHGEIPLEKLRSLNPDTILEFREQVTDEQRRELYATWSQVGPIRAIEEQQVRSVGGPEWLSAGPRIAIELYRFVAVLSEPR